MPTDPNAPPGVLAVQCPKCKKFVLVEAKDAGKVVACLLCKAPIQVGTPSS